MVRIRGTRKIERIKRTRKERKSQTRVTSCLGIPKKTQRRETSRRKENGRRFQKEVNGKIRWRWEIRVDECIEEENEGIRAQKRSGETMVGETRNV